MLTDAMRVIFRNIVRVESNDEEFQKKRALVVIFGDLLELSRVYPMNAEGNWVKFAANSRIEELLSNEKVVSGLEDWLKLKKRFVNGQIE